MSDTPNSSPVSLAAGSYDYDTLKKGLDKAGKGADKNYGTAVDKALEEASDMPHRNQDPRDIAGYKFVAVERKDLGVTENVQVFDAKLAEKTQADQPDAISEADLVTNQAQTTAAAVEAASPSKE